MQAHELSFQSQILFDIGEEGGELIHGQAQSFRRGQLPQVLTIASPYIPESLAFPRKQNIQRCW